MVKIRSDKNKKENPGKKKKNIRESSDEPRTGMFFPVKSLTYTILFVLFLFSFYIRGIVPMKNVLERGFTGFAMDDSVFHMRLVENTIHFFPHRIFFDAFTLYPYGNPLHWGPLFDQLIAFLALVAGFIFNGGLPAQSTIDTIGAFFPAIMGALIVFPVFIIGRELKDEKAGLIGAFLTAIFPGQFLERSLMGFMDNHVAEVFYLTIMMMFFIIAIKKAESITFDRWLNSDWSVLKTPLSYSLLAGIFFGAYLLNWTNGVFFAVVFGIFILTQYIIDHFKGKPTEYLGVVGVIAYLVAFILMLPYAKISNGFSSNYYSLLHLTVTGGGAAIFAFLTIVSREMNKRELSGKYFLGFVVVTVVVGLGIIWIFLPDLYYQTAGNWKFIFEGRSGGGLTIAEASPICGEVSLFALVSCDNAFAQFGYNYFLATLTILLLGYYIIKRAKAEYTLIAVWSIFVLAIMLAQNRFAYYYSVNVAILVGFLCSIVMDLADWKVFSNDLIYSLKKINIYHIASLVIVVAITGFLPAGASPYQSSCGGWPWSCEKTQWGAIGEGETEWHDALTWMRYNTPEPDLPYYSIYEPPPAGQPTYNYSKNDYGVMSWWDYGHIITYWGHRIPNANPFQAGIGGGDSHAPGASTFLIAQTEDDANTVLGKLGINGEPGARYVLSNAYMAYAILTVFVEWDVGNSQEYYTSVQTNQGNQMVPTLKYYDTMESRLHIFDTGGDIKRNINGLKSYRLVHESTAAPWFRGGNLEKFYKYIYNLLYEGSLTVEDSGYAKIFEHVKGAKITGRAPPNTTVTISNTIKTNIGRTIQYSQKTSSEETYEFTVPYSTEGPIPGETQFDTKPAGAYTVTAGSVTKQISVNEKDVLNGGTIILDMV